MFELTKFLKINKFESKKLIKNSKISCIYYRRTRLIILQSNHLSAQFGMSPIQTPNKIKPTYIVDIQPTLSKKKQFTRVVSSKDCYSNLYWNRLVQ